MKNNIRVYNTLTGKKDLIKPLKDKQVNLFVCGPTVYDFSHIGHARTYIIFDCFAKYLKLAGLNVFYLQNITDVDDKIIQRAREKGVGAKELADAFLGEYLKDMKDLRVTSVKKYGKLSHRTVLQAEDSVSRIDYSKNKRNRGDFALWKFENPGEPTWPAP